MSSVSSSSRFQLPADHTLEGSSGAQMVGFLPPYRSLPQFRAQPAALPTWRVTQQRGVSPLPPSLFPSLPLKSFFFFKRNAKISKGKINHSEIWWDQTTFNFLCYSTEVLLTKNKTKQKAEEAAALPSSPPCIFARLGLPATTCMSVGPAHHSPFTKAPEHTLISLRKQGSHNSQL